MPISRRQLLYLMLAALAIAGASGVVALLVGDSGAVWRCAGTALAAALACAIMLPMSGWADNPTTRAAGFAGMGVAIVELGLGAVLIWGQFLSAAHFDFLGFATLIVGVGGLMAVRFLKEIHVDRWRLASRGGATSCVAASILFLIAAYDETINLSSSNSELIAESAANVFVSGIIGSLALIGWRPHAGNGWRITGAAAALVGLALGLYRIWGDPHALRVVWPTGAFCLAALVAHSNACFQGRLFGWQCTVRFFAIACAGADALCMVWYAGGSGFGWDSHGIDETLPRLIIALGLVCVSATLSLLVFGRLNRRPTVELSKSTFDHVSLVCPRCARKLVLPVGGALCSDCKLHIDVTIRVARCATCGYDLSGLRADTCPECGTLIPMSDGTPTTVPSPFAPATAQAPAPAPSQQTPHIP